MPDPGDQLVFLRWGCRRVLRRGRHDQIILRRRRLRSGHSQAPAEHAALPPAPKSRTTRATVRRQALMNLGTGQPAGPNFVVKAAGMPRHRRAVTGIPVPCYVSAGAPAPCREAESMPTPHREATSAPRPCHEAANAPSPRCETALLPPSCRDLAGQLTWPRHNNPPDATVWPRGQGRADGPTPDYASCGAVPELPLRLFVTNSSAVTSATPSSPRSFAMTTAIVPRLPASPQHANCGSSARRADKTTHQQSRCSGRIHRGRGD